MKPGKFSCRVLAAAMAVSLAAGSAAAAPDSPQAELSQALAADRAAADFTRSAGDREKALVAGNRSTALEIQLLELQERKLMHTREALKERIARLEEAERRWAEISLFIENDLFDASARLNDTVREGLPFLRTERDERARFVTESVNDPALSLGEKFRRTAEALTAEAAYGAECEMTTEEAALDGRRTTLTVIRTGRVGLWALTLDRSKAGVRSDPETGFKSDPELLPLVTALAETLAGRFKVTLPLIEVRKPAAAEEAK
ncbi:DUF3450 family protein [Sutterella sp.]|uniref:DUF3450 family protein n=1 Tax=Sutterella sp. TaxID=1981025 RepID=UPI0026DEF377|nr:DUF3450 family protein [Sutterella sp.]MDO5531788.1 DUF3450 family protein [Sutterella sp.]